MMVTRGLAVSARCSERVSLLSGCLAKHRGSLRSERQILRRRFLPRIWRSKCRWQSPRSNFESSHSKVEGVIPKIGQSADRHVATNPRKAVQIENTHVDLPTVKTCRRKAAVENGEKFGMSSSIRI